MNPCFCVVYVLTKIYPAVVQIQCCCSLVFLTVYVFCSNWSVWQCCQQCLMQQNMSYLCITLANRCFTVVYALIKIYSFVFKYNVDVYLLIFV